MSELKTLEDVLLDELKDIYSAETQLVKALPKMEKHATDPALKEALSAHLEETRVQVDRLDKIASILGRKLSGKTCKAMKGLIEEGEEVMDEDSDNEALLDTLLIGAAQRIEHYEIAAYGTARAIAGHLGYHEVVRLLQESLDEESAADEKLSLISEEEILPRCGTEFGDEEEEGDDDDKLRSGPGRSRSHGRMQAKMKTSRR